MSTKPLVFVAMPFGKKPDATRSRTIDFDAVYEKGIKPALARFDVDCIRADEERSGGVIHLPMFERLLLAEIVIVDVTIDNANVFYELGVRHAARPASTIIISGKDGSLPFDIAMIRAVPYQLEDGTLSDAGAAALGDALAIRIEDALTKAETADSPLFQLIPTFPGIDLPRGVTETFRGRVEEAELVRRRLAEALRIADVRESIAAIATVEREFGLVSSDDAELVMDMLIAYRSRKAYDELIALVEAVPEKTRARNTQIAQIHAFALKGRNNGVDRQRAVDVLKALIATSGPNAEAAGLLASVYKDEFREARARGDEIRALGHLEQAIDWYRQGFLADPRDYYPGVNLCTLLAIEGSEEAQEELRTTLPAVVFAVSRLGGTEARDYWLVATAFELAVLGNEWRTATKALRRMGVLAKEHWMIDSTAKNLELIRAAAPPSIDADKLNAMYESLVGLQTA